MAPWRWRQALLILTLGVFGGCVSWLGGGSASGPESTDGPLVLELSVDKPTYQLGEAVQVTVRLRNRSAEKIVTQNLHTNTLGFYFGPVQTGDRLLRQPVSSPLEPPSTSATLKRKGVWERTFVFTRLSEFPGNFILTAAYKPTEERAGHEGTMRGATIAANPTTFTVAEERAFARDPEGILLKEEAIKICQAALARPAQRSDAVLIENEAGFFDWWVVLELPEPNLETNEPTRKAWFVNPYLAAIRGEAQPYAPGTKGGGPNYTIRNRWGSSNKTDG